MTYSRVLVPMNKLGGLAWKVEVKKPGRNSFTVDRATTSAQVAQVRVLKSE